MGGTGQGGRDRGVLPEDMGQWVGLAIQNKPHRKLNHFSSTDGRGADRVRRRRGLYERSDAESSILK